MVTHLSDSHGHGADQLHTWWELSYAQYLTIPRSVMQSMPDKWQGKMAALLSELDERIDWRPPNGRYFVDLREERHDDGPPGSRGKRINDPFADYQRGRRRIERRL